MDSVCLWAPWYMALAALDSLVSCQCPGLLPRTHRVLALVLAVAARLALDALPPEGLDPDRELRGELQTGRVACSTTAHTRRLNLITSNATLKGS